MDTKILEEVGFTTKESQLYVELLKIGSASATELIQKTGFHRAMVYDLLERLIEKGLAGFVIKGKKKFFEATAPRRLLEREKQKQEKLQSLVKELEEFARFTEKLEVKIYKGKEGRITVFEDLLESGEKEWLVLGSSGTTAKILPYYLEQFHLRREKLGIKVKGLFTLTSQAKARAEEVRKRRFSEVRFLPASMVPPTVIQIYGDKVGLHSSKSPTPFIILIENEDIADAFRQYFKVLWNLGKSSPPISPS